MQEEEIVVTFDEQIVLTSWSRMKMQSGVCLLASGYLKGGAGGISWHFAGTVVSSENHKSGNAWNVFRICLRAGFRHSRPIIMRLFRHCCRGI